MATATGNYVCDNSSLTNFKSWAQAIGAAFSTFGWVQTSDTGQVNWGTIASVPSSAYVYEVWKANDTLAATLPIFIKMQYGFSSTSPRIQVSVGTGSDGAGNITGPNIGTWLITNLNANEGSTTFPCFFSGSAGEFRMYMWSSSVSPYTGVVFGVERAKDSSGADLGAYFTVLSAQSNNTGSGGNQQTILPSSAANRDAGFIAPALTNASNTGAFGGTVASMPVLPALGFCGNPMLGWMTCCANDAANGAIVTAASTYGATHTYVAFTANGFSTCLGQRAVLAAVVAGLMRYE